MNGTKHWLASRTMWGGMMAFVGGILHSMGYVFDDPAWYADTIVKLIAALLEVIGAIVVLYGRIKATKRIEPVVLLLGLCVLVLFSGGCKATASERFVFRQHAINAEAFAQKVEAIDTPTAEQWSATVRWIRSQSEHLKALNAWAGGEPVPQIPPTPGAHRHDRARPDRQADRGSADLSTTDRHDLPRCDPAIDRAGVLLTGRVSGRRIDQTGGDGAGGTVVDQRPGAAKRTLDGDEPTHGQRSRVGEAVRGGRDTRGHDRSDSRGA